MRHANGGDESTAPSWKEIERWARESTEHRPRWQAFASPKFLGGIVLAIILVIAGLHMAESMTPARTDPEYVEAPAHSKPDERDVRDDPGGASDQVASESSPGDRVPSEPVASDDAAVKEAPNTIYVHVTGAVTTPGLIELAPGARVNDAILAAGGMLAEADESAVNVARAATDGEQIYVPREGEEPSASLARADDSQAPTAAEGAAGAPATGLINVNAADSETLQQLNGIGPATAEKIISHREINGPFTSVESLTDVSGIGPATVEKIRDRVTV